MVLQLPEIVQALLDPKAYPEPTSKVEMVQTQMSFVFLAGNYVYKVKKAVNLGYLDYTTLEKRYFYCQREVELNQRLCPDAYLGVVAITRHRGQILLRGQGEVIEYAVKMRYLPQEAMMNVLLTRNQVSLEMVTRVAQKLADFHQRAETSATISTFGALETIRQNTEENFSQTIKYIGNTLSQAQYRHIKGYTNSFIENNAPLFRRRIADGKIRDCHGDLHAAHICFTDGIYIYDCIEFNDRFRYCDVASEIAFLAMDLDYYGRVDLSQGFVNAYVAFSQDKGLPRLLSFYKCYRAYVRGKVESFKLDDPHISAKEKAKTLAVAKNYFELAEGYINLKGGWPMIVTAWNNGKRHSTGAGYGFKVDIKDRDRYFRKDWRNIFLELQGEAGEVVVNIDKPSFWDPTCRELISRDIGAWLIKNKKAPWLKGRPPKMRMEHIDDNRFKVEFI